MRKARDLKRSRSRKATNSGGRPMNRSVAIRAGAAGAMLALALVSPLRADDRSPLPMASNPEAVGLSSQRLSRITGWIQDNVAKGALSGASVLVARHGKIALYEGVGFRDREAN